MNKIITFVDKDAMELQFQKGDKGQVFLELEGTSFVIEDVNQWIEIREEIEKFFPPRVFGGREETLLEKKIV